MLKTYKLQIVLILGLIYSVAVWHVAGRYHDASWAKEKAEMQAAVTAEEDKRAKLSNDIGIMLETKLANLKITQTTINRKVEREIRTEPIYTTCIVPDSGVQLIEDAIRQGQSSRK